MRFIPSRIFANASFSMLVTILSTGRGADPVQCGIPTAIITTSKLVVCTAARRGNYGLALERGTESLTPHYHYGQPLQAAVFLCLFILVTRERVKIFFYAYLIRRSVLLKLVADVFCNYLFISSYCIHIISSAPKIPRPILVFQICMSVKYHQATLSLEESHELCCTQVRRYAIMYNKLRKLKTA